MVLNNPIIAGTCNPIITIIGHLRGLKVSYNHNRALKGLISEL